MAWLIDSRMWEDPWYRSLPTDSREVFKVVLFGNFRTALPGLVKAASVIALSDAIALPVEVTQQALTRVLMPDDLGKIHVYFDPLARVIRVPAAPRYNKCANPNTLTSWFRCWRDVPDCQLKFAHLESIPAGVNLQNAEMERAWARTFGPVIASQISGLSLRGYAALDPGAHSGQPSANGSGTVPPSGSGIGSGSGSGSYRFATVAEPSLNGSNSTDGGTIPPLKETGGAGGESRVGGDGAGRGDDSGRPGEGQAVPPGGHGPPRRANGVPPGGASPARRRLPRGFE